MGWLKMDNTPILPLDHITVLDLSHALAGPHCTTMLADYGANVIKVEPPSGDISRAWGDPMENGQSDYFVSLHRNKKSIVLDLKTDTGRDILLSLVEKADVVVENFRVGVLNRLGVGYEAMRKRNPKIVFCSISGFGQDGPYRDRPALDLILQAEAGLISITGSADGEPARAGISIADLAAGMNAAFAIMVALQARDRTGEGQHIDLSMLESQLSLLGIMVANYCNTNDMPRPWGTAYKAIVPYQTFKTQTRDIALAIGSEKLWKAFCTCMSLQELCDDPRFATNAARVKNRETLVPLLQEAFYQRPYEEWEALLLAGGIPVGAINDFGEVINHPQVLARDALVEVDHPVAGKARIIGVPARLGSTPGSIRTPSPTLGEHTRETLANMLGFSETELDALESEGAIHSPLVTHS